MRYIQKDEEGNVVFKINVEDIPKLLGSTKMLERIYEIEEEKERIKAIQNQ